MTNNNNNVHSCLLLCLLCSLLLLLFTATTTRADLPLHCEHKQIKGDWLILMSSANKLAKRPLKCQDLTPLSFVFHQTMAVSLQSPNVVTRFLKESGAAKRSVLGAWTMVYDQGFEFTAENYKFFAYNNFTRHEGSDMITSFCAETNFGWYERTERKTGAVSFGCYYARKMNKKESDTVTDLPVNMKLYENPEEHKELNTHALSDSASMTLSEDSKLFKNDAKLIRLINEKQSLWKAKAYKRFEKLTNGQIKAYNGMAPNVKLNQYLNKMKNKKQQRQAESMSDISVSSLPESWDWRNVSGVNYVSPVRDQGSCGSCYTFATLAAFESRIRILTKNKEQAILAPQDVVSCSAYNQKCSGGFPFLVGKQTNDFSLVTEDCFPYKGDAGVPCSLKCKNPRLRVTVNGDYQYIGGFYGAGNTEELMMREIYTNGPIPVSYQVYSDFKYYENGIYSNVKAEKVRSKDAVNDFEATTHSVAIVGWGVDKETDTKYWIAKNSWGADWGMDGYFLIKKGVDEAAIEAQAVAPGVPVLHYRRHKK